MYNFDDMDLDMEMDGMEDSMESDMAMDADMDDGMMGQEMEPAGDPWQEYADLDGDGIEDAILMDSDGNGVVDTIIHVQEGGYDTPATFTELHDYDQDDLIDSGTVYADTNGDGLYDQVMELMDTTGDGAPDHMVIHTDLDGDMVEDMTTSLQLGGEDGQEIEALEVYDHVSGESYVYAPGLESDEIFYTSLNDLDNFDPAQANPDAIVGDPGASMAEWEFQGDTGRCALYSQKFIIDELTGQDVDMEEMARIAQEQNWFDEETGTPPFHMNKMLDYYGIDNEMSFHNDMSDIEECLNNGGKVIVSVDADEIWYGETDNMFVPVDGANHALQVAGVDYSDPDHPMVILNDSGSPDGCGEMVPMDVFMDAWQDGDCQMITCYA